MSDLIERLGKYLNAIPDEFRKDSPNEMIALLDECLAALSAPLDEKLEEELNAAIRQFRHNCGDNKEFVIAYDIESIDKLIIRMARENKRLDAVIERIEDSDIDSFVDPERHKSEASWSAAELKAIRDYANTNRSKV